MDGCSFLLMGRALRTIAGVSAAALLAAACGTNGDTATPDPTAAQITATAVQATAEPSPLTPVPNIVTSTEMIPASTPTPEPTLYVHKSGLACYGELSEGWNYDFVPDLVVGFPSVDEAAAHWWQNESEARAWHSRDGTYSISAEDLTQYPSEDNSVAFRDASGNAQVVVYAAQLPDGSWIIDAGTGCVYFDESTSRSGGTRG